MSVRPVRFAIEAAVLVAVGLALAAADLELLPFVLVMAAAWILVATAEKMLVRGPVALSPARQRPAARTRETPSGTVRPAPPVVSRPEPQAEPEVAEAAVAPASEPEPEPEREAESGPPPPLEAVPQPAEPEPEPESEAEVEAERPEREEPVVELPRAAALRRPDGWNLWDLEQRAHERAGEDRERDEEWNALFVYLRDFARPDGTLPPEFDGLVEESFQQLIARRA